MAPWRPFKSPKSTRCAMIRRVPSTGSNGLGAATIREYKVFSTIPSSGASRMIRALQPSAARWDSRWHLRSGLDYFVVKSEGMGESDARAAVEGHGCRFQRVAIVAIEHLLSLPDISSEAMNS